MSEEKINHGTSAAGDNNASGGGLFIVSTPIGNLEDITLRALRILQEADIVAAEDTRHTMVLFQKYNIHTRLESFHIFNEHRKTSQLLDAVEAGNKVALVSDAGTPGIADPGFLLVREAVKRGIEPVIVPGVSALTFAAVASALPLDELAFFGFPPVKSGRKKAFFERLNTEGKSCFIYESPHRIAKTLAMIAEISGGDTPCAVIKEATKVHEKIFRGTAGELAEYFSSLPQVKGEYVIAFHPGMKLDSAGENPDTLE